MVNLFNGSGAFNQEEVNEILEIYKSTENQNYFCEIRLGERVNPKVERMVNAHNLNMSRLVDRLVLTLAEMRGLRRTDYIEIFESSVYVCGCDLGVMEIGGYSR